MIINDLQEEQDRYDTIKRALRKKEEERLARLEAKERKAKFEQDEESKTAQDEDEVLCEDDPDVDDDITISIASGIWRGPSSVTSGSPNRIKKNESTSENEDPASNSSLFMSALSYIFSGTSGGDQEKENTEDDG